MQRPNLTSTLIARSGLTLIVWLLALALLAACTTVIVKTEPEVSKPAVQLSASDKKQQFFTFMKPRVEKENKRITEQRTQLLKLQDKKQLSGSDQQWLQALAAEYEVSLDGQLTPKQWQELKSRVDVVPLEMALVQTANESAWGTSRFALKGNNYFGQWCYEKGCGIVPEQRKAGASHEVRSFSDARESVDAYINNINTTRAYAEFRNLRQQSRNKGRALNAERLALGLKSYSERGMDYVKTIQAMIRTNRDLIEQS